MISSTINQKIAEALKAHDEIRLSTLRLLSSALNYEKIAKQHELSGEEELVVVGREAKKRKEAINAYKNVKALDRAEKEEKELGILQEFLPRQMSDSELERKVSEAISETRAKSLVDIGRVMGVIMTRVKGQADGGKVSELVRAKLK